MSETVIETLTVSLEELKTLLGFERDIVDLELRENEVKLFLKGKPFERIKHVQYPYGSVPPWAWTGGPKDDVLYSLKQEDQS